MSTTHAAPGRFTVSAFDALSAHVAILGQDGTIVGVNRAWTHFASENDGHSELGRNYLRTCEAVRGEDAGAALAVAGGIRRVLRGGAAFFELEYPCHSPTEQRFFCVRVTSFVQDGECFALVAHENITRRKLAELHAAELNANLEARVHERTAELAATNAELASVNRELAQFAHVASHDLQEPLRMIGSYAELLSRRYGGQLDDRADTYLGFMTGGVSRLQTLIRDLLALARVGAEGATQVVDVGSLFDDLTRTVPLDGADVGRDDLPGVQASATQMRQLLQNLLGNALKFRAERPVHVWLSAQPHDEIAHGEMVHFTLRDNGIGIAPEHTERIFEVFQRLHGRDRFDGSGIGLAICRKIVEQHGGQLWVESHEGEGSAFHFTLPRTSEQHPPPSRN